MTDDALEAFLAEGTGGPVVMLNLLRFVPAKGRADDGHSRSVAYWRRPTRTIVAGR